ncbi:MAG: DUF58 domain-containing protein [Syntrophaceae bacterium]|nr:DUF58 domain-containing protein [Syntrophaceae bacterium]
MLDQTIYKKIRHIEIRSHKAVNQLFAGEYHSVFKGQGLEFYEVREYVPGDDIRLIDWNVSARLGSLYVKKFIEERQQSIILCVDVSASQDFGSQKLNKNEVAAEIAAVLAFSAIKNNDLVGLLMFSDRIEKYIPPKRGRCHVLLVIKEILSFKRQGKKTDMVQALRYLSRVNKKSSVLFVISDFLAQGYEQPISILSKKHDLIPVIIKDRMEKQLPELPMVCFEDPESGELMEVDLRDEKLRKAYNEASANELINLRRFFRSLKLDHLELESDGEYAAALNRFFKTRERRIAH